MSRPALLESAAGSASPQTRRPARAANRPARPAGALALDCTATVDVAGLDHEVALLRAAIRRLAGGEDAADQVKTLAELRHQIDTLCTALKTQRVLSGGDADVVSKALAQVLEEIGDGMGVPK